MFSKDDLIIYGSTGVCKVRDICELKGSRDGRLYYKLEPVFDKCIIMVPADTKIFMRPVISRDEAIDLITKLPLLEISVPESRNNRQLSEYYKTSFTFHDCEELGTMIKTIYTKIHSQTSLGKKPCQTDLKYIKKAEDLLYGELSVVLDIPFDTVPGFIKKTIGEAKDSLPLNGGADGDAPDLPAVTEEIEEIKEVCQCG